MTFFLAINQKYILLGRFIEILLFANFVVLSKSLLLIKKAKMTHFWGKILVKNFKK